MTYALVIDATIEAVGRLPNSARRLDNGAWVMGLADAPAELVRATGWLEVVDVARPEDTATTTFDHSIELVAGTPTVTWTARVKTEDELGAESAAADRERRVFVLTQAIPTLRAWSTQAGITNVTQGNAVATLQTVVDRLGVFFDRFADLLENQYGGD